MQLLEYLGKAETIMEPERLKTIRARGNKGI